MAGYLVSFNYTNHRGVFSRREVDVECVEYLRNPGYGYKPGWFLSGICQEKKERRSFALDSIYIPEAKSADLKLVKIDVAQGNDT